MQGRMDPPPIVRPAKPPLFTPSASPQPFSAITATRASSSVPLPASRSRVSSTPQRLSSSTPRSSSQQRATEEPFDFHKERQASTLRLLDVWSQLAERYTRRLDEDDIVDIVTGKVVKDNGVLRHARKRYFGESRALKKNQDDEAEEGEEEDEEEEDEDEDEEEHRRAVADDDDELDAFVDADDDDDEEEGILELHGKVEAVPPVTPQDPRDAADLREFLETERLRRDDLGSEPEDDPEVLYSPDEDGTDVYETGGSEIHSDIFQVDNEAEEHDPEDRAREVTRRKRPKNDVLPDNSDSEDELNSNFPEEDINESVPVPDTVSDNEVEIIDPPSPLPANTQINRVKPKSKPGPQIQLQTPPLSRTSISLQPSSPSHADDVFVTPPPPDDLVINLTPEIPFAHDFSNSPIPIAGLGSKGKRGLNRDESPTQSPGSKRGTTKLIPEVVIQRSSIHVNPASGTRSNASSQSSIHVKPASGTRFNASSQKSKSTPASSSKAARTVSKKADKPRSPSSSATAIQPQPSSRESSKTPRPPSSASPSQSPFPGVVHASEAGSYSTDGNSRKSASTSPRKRKRSVAPSLPPAPQPSLRIFPEQNLASSSKVQLEHIATREESDSDIRVKDARNTVQQRSPRKRRSKSRPQAVESDTEGYSGSNSETSRGSLRPNGYHSHGYYNHPPPLYSYPQIPLYAPPPPPPLPVPPHPNHQVHHQQPQHNPAQQRAFTPMPDPQTQYIFSQFMQHLSAAIVTGNWIAPQPPTGHPPGPGQHGQLPPRAPFTPSSHHRISMNPEYEYAYNTPSHNPYAYGYPFPHPDFSRATAPPDTPDESSSVNGSGGAGRRRSLVYRSQSRGRRVSFRDRSGSTERDRRRERDSRTDDEDEDEDMEPFSSPLKGKVSTAPTTGGARSQSVSGFLRKRKSTPAVHAPSVEGSSTKSKGKGKARAVDYVSSGEESGSGVSGEEEEQEELRLASQARGWSRGQTPAPGRKAGSSISGTVQKDLKGKRKK